MDVTMSYQKRLELNYYRNIRLSVQKTVMEYIGFKNAFIQGLDFYGG